MFILTILSILLFMIAFVWMITYIGMCRGKKFSRAFRDAVIVCAIVCGVFAIVVTLLSHF